VYPPLPFLGNGSVKISLSLLGNGYVFNAVRVVSKESKRLVLARTSCWHSVLFQSLAASNAADQWRILSVNKYNGTEFISSFEHKKYPFYGVQFHPEKNAFEWKLQSIPHSAESILVEQFYGNFVVNEGKLPACALRVQTYLDMTSDQII
jgi:hypothetical protein